MTEHVLDVPLLLSEARDCAACSERLRASLRDLEGVAAVEPAPGGRLTLTYDPAVLSAPALEARAKALGRAVAGRYRHASFRLEGLHCTDCGLTIEHALSHEPGVTSAAASFAAGRLAVEYDAEATDPARIAGAVRRVGYQAFAPGEGSQAAVLRIPELCCADEARAIEGALRQLPGVAAWHINLVGRMVRVEFDPDALSADRLLAAIRLLGMTPVLASQAGGPLRRWRDVGFLSTLASGLLLALALLAEWLISGPGVPLVLYALAMLSGGWMAARQAVRAARAGRLDMNVLMTVAVLGALPLGEWEEAAMVAFLFALAQLLERLSLDRARGAVRALLDIAPAEATVRRDGGERRVPVDAVVPGDTLLIRPGERVALDGMVRAGLSAVNQAPITGESAPVEKGPGAHLFAGSINGAGALEAEVTHGAQDTMLARIIALVEEAQAQRAPSQTFVERFAAIYTPAVIAGAVCVATLPWALFGQPAEPWIYRALVLLVISCPCALVISTPVAVVSAVTRAARAGVLVKGGKHLEVLGGVRALALDKTGTLTHGRPEVVEVRPLRGRHATEILRLAAAVEARSEHPLASAVLRAARARGLAWADASRFTAVPGRGASAEVAGTEIHVGNPRYAEELGVSDPILTGHLVELEAAGYTPVILSEGRTAIGVLGLADRLRESAGGALRELRALGVGPIVMLTGDVQGTAQAIGRQAGVDEVRAELLPEQKVAAVAALAREHGSAAMVGDGINDAPALAAASVGIAMGAAGTDAAIETADVALMSDDLRQLPVALALGRRTLAIIRANIALSLLTKLVFVLLTLFGQATLWMAVFADMGTSLLVIANGLRLLRHSGPAASLQAPAAAPARSACCNAGCCH
jgi:Cd2+/Zn2+-exporting ATPase